MFAPGDDSVLLLVLATLLAAVWGTATPVIRRRLGRGVAFVLGLGLSTGMAVVVLAIVVGPDRLRAVLPDILPQVAAPLPQVHSPAGLATRPAPGGTMAGTVTHVRDGDTIVVGRTPIRFTDIDCAELGTPAGEIAAQAMRGLAAGQYVRCHLIGRRSYDREIGSCALADGRDLGMVLVAQGLCVRR